MCAKIIPIDTSQRFDTLLDEIKHLYQEHSAQLLFHGWHHIQFVWKKTMEFAREIRADVEIASAAALTHDLNYIVKPNSEPEDATELRSQLLTKAGYTQPEITHIEDIIMESHTRIRNENISLEGMALSDADSLFKSLPTTPFFSGLYIVQNKVDIYKLAEKVTSEQNPLMDKGIFFYTDYAKKHYLAWAQANLQIWSYIKDSFEDKDVKEMLDTAKAAGVL